MIASLPPKLYFRIGEVAGLVGVEPHVLRYWEREFRSIRPTKSAKGQRVYSRKDVEALIVVKDLLYAQGFTIAGAKKRLQRTPESSSGPVAAPIAHETMPAIHAPDVREHHDEHHPAHVTHEPHATHAPDTTRDTAPESTHARNGHTVADHADTPHDLGQNLTHERPISLGRHAEEALLRTLDRHAPLTPAQPAQVQVQAQAVGGTRKALMSLRAEVEALLSELGG